MKMQVSKLKDNAIIPTYATPGSSGFDLYANHDIDIYPGQRVLVGTGLSFNIPYGFEIQVRPRSGMAIKYGITVLNTPGTIDEDYTGELKVILINHGKEVFRVEGGDRVAQGVLQAVPDQVYFEVVDNIDKNTDRAAGGFGHSGVN